MWPGPLALNAMTICAKLAAVGLHLVSWHSGPMANGEDYEWLTPGVYARMECSKQLSVQGGVYRNSEAGISFYAAGVWEHPEWPVFVAAGAVTGYEDQPVGPIGGLGVKAGEHFRFMMAPPAGSDGVWLLTVMMDF